jgi:hypothetical protein
MERTGVSSSNIASIGYDSANSILEVQFLNGSIYHYFDVPRDVHSDLMSAASHGTYLDRYVKKGGYRYRQIR